MIPTALAVLLFLPVIPTGDDPNLDTAVAAAEAAQCPDGFVCIHKEDFAAFSTLLRDHHCRANTNPEIKADSVKIIVDKEGRIFGSGTGDHPYKLQIDWCNYEIQAEGNLRVQAAQRVEPNWGFRWRVKAALGLLASEAVNRGFEDSVDGGLLIEPLYVHWVNLNAYVGVRSVGAGLGFDLTDNFGVYAGYSLLWGNWRSAPLASAYFAF